MDFSPISLHRYFIRKLDEKSWRKIFLPLYSSVQAHRTAFTRSNSEPSNTQRMRWNELRRFLASNRWHFCIVQLTELLKTSLITWSWVFLFLLVHLHIARKTMSAQPSGRTGWAFVNKMFLFPRFLDMRKIRGVGHYSRGINVTNIMAEMRVETSLTLLWMAKSSVNRTGR